MVGTLAEAAHIAVADRVVDTDDRYSQDHPTARFVGVQIDLVMSDLPPVRTQYSSFRLCYLHLLLLSLQSIFEHEGLELLGCTIVVAAEVVEKAKRRQ